MIIKDQINIFWTAKFVNIFNKMHMEQLVAARFPKLICIDLAIQPFFLRDPKNKSNIYMIKFIWIFLKLLNFLSKNSIG